MEERGRGQGGAAGAAGAAASGGICGKGVSVEGTGGAKSLKERRTAGRPGELDGARSGGSRAPGHQARRPPGHRRLQLFPREPGTSATCEGGTTARQVRSTACGGHGGGDGDEAEERAGGRRVP